MFCTSEGSEPSRPEADCVRLGGRVAQTASPQRLQGGLDAPPVEVWTVSRLS